MHAIKRIAKHDLEFVLPQPGHKCARGPKWLQATKYARILLENEKQILRMKMHHRRLVVYVNIISYRTRNR